LKTPIFASHEITPRYRLTPWASWAPKEFAMSDASKCKITKQIFDTAVSSNTLTWSSTIWRRGSRGLLAFLCLIVALVTANARASADSITSAQAQRIVSQYSPSFSSPGSCCSSEAPSGGPLMGNGNLGVVVVNPINTMTFLLGKNEFWSLSGGQVEPMASMALSIPNMSGASFAMQENIYTGTVTGQFSLNGNEIQTNSWVSSNDTTNNFLFTQFTYTGSGTQAVTVSLAPGNGNTYPTSSGSSGSVLYYNVAADSTSTVGGYNTHQVRIAVGVVGATGTISGSTLQFTLSPGTTVTLVSSIMSNYDSSSYTTQSISNVSGSTSSSISSELSSNESWWASFWDASYVEFANNPVLQEEYYGSLYLLGASSEPNTPPPGLWGPWVEANPAWAGDYTTDYNFETPPLAYFPTNHVALANSYDTAMETWLPEAESFATSNGYTGALWQCHFGPLPNGSYETGSGDENIKSNGAFLATIMLQHYYYTPSATYAAAIWPAISESATFYQNYLTSNGTTYDDLDDSQVENDPYPETNGTMSLGFIRNLFQGAINLSTVLGENSSQRATWQSILNNLTTFNGETSTTGGLPYPTYTRNGLTVFANEQIGDQWATNGDEVWGISTADAIGLGSSSTLLTIAQNTIGELGPGALQVMWYPAGARVGYSPSTLLSDLTTEVNNQAEPNLYVNINGGGIENEALVPATVSQMMMQSFQGKIIVFPDWPSGTNAHFGDNLAYGNFLVSSAIDNNAVLYVRIISQAGNTVSIANPWPGTTPQFYRNGTNEGTLSGTTLSITTSTNDVLLLAPNGTSDATITSEMEDSLAQLGGNGGPGSVLPYNVNAIYTNGSTFPSTGGADGVGNAYSATLLGASAAFNGTTFTYGPSNAPDAFTNVTVALTPGSFSSLNILAYAIYGDQASQTFQVNYTNGTYSTVTQSISDWGIPGNYSGETKVATMAYRNTYTGGENNGTTTYVYGYTLPVNSSLTVESITLPANNNVRVLGIQDEATSAEGPYGGTPAGIPGTVMAENYDTGGAGVGYFVNSINGTDNGYRSDGVDLETASAPATGNDIGWTSTGQWFRYTVNVAAAGTYNVTFEVAAPSAVTDGFHIANSSGTNLSGSVNVPSTGGWQTWTTLTASVTLPVGQQVLTIYQDNGGWNIDSAAFAATSLPYNVNAIYTNGSTFSSTGGADREGDAFSATLLGATQAFNGTTFTYGPSNAPDAFNNVSIPLAAGSFSSLNILAYAIAGSQPSQTFTIHYTDGTTTTDTQGISDWGIPAGYSGETQVKETAYRNTYTGGESSAWPGYVYGYTLAANSAKTVSSLTIPANADVFVLGVQDQQ
jgi:alpha-L-fucosidase 2